MDASVYPIFQGMRHRVQIPEIRENTSQQLGSRTLPQKIPQQYKVLQSSASGSVLGEKHHQRYVQAVV